ncbi:SDR family oxidoreductase [Leptospira perdikensis]|nr:SDR family oxidoreductase [Leptospira perdikensis]
MSSSKGIGKGIATALAAEGANVIISSSNLGNLQIASDEIFSKTKVKPTLLEADAKKLDEYLKKVSDLFNSLDGVDILVTNSPGPAPIHCDQLSEANLQGSLDVNLKAQILTSQLALPFMVKKKWGRLIHLTSTTAKEPEEGMILSNLTRAAVGAYSKTVSREYGKYGITSNSILTGGVLTDRTFELSKKEALEKNVAVEEIINHSNQLFPTGYFPKPDEFGQIIAFLTSANSGFLNGLSLPIDGGLLRSH